MKIIFYSVHDFERPYLEAELSRSGMPFTFIASGLSEATLPLVDGHEAACLFVHDRVTSEMARELGKRKVKLLLLRSAGFNHVDLEACAQNGIRVCRVPEYSPFAVAEHTVALLLALNRKLPRAVARVKDLNFSLNGLVGFDIHGKTVGVVGTGKIGGQVCRILRGFGCEVVAFDPFPDSSLQEQGICEYVPLEDLFRRSDIISLHAPLVQENFHLIDASAFKKMKSKVYLINTSRGGLIDTGALIQGLKSGQVAGAALDVYEEEENLFFADHSSEVLRDDVLARLLTFPNVIITAHQGFLTDEALREISRVTLLSAEEFRKGEKLSFEVRS